MSVHLKFLYGGSFYLSKERNPCIKYRPRLAYEKKGVDPDLLSKMELLEFFKEGTGIDSVLEMWFCKGEVLQHGLKEIKCDNDILLLCGTSGSNNTLEVYVVQAVSESPKTVLDSARDRSIMTSSQICPTTPQVDSTTGPNPIPFTQKLLQKKGKSAMNSSPPKKGKVISSTSTSKPKKQLPQNTSQELIQGPLSVEFSSSEDDEVFGSDSSGDDSDVPAYVNVFDDDTDDDAIFEEHIDIEVPDPNLCIDDGEEDIFDVRVVSEDERSYSGSGDERRYRYPEFNPLVDFSNKICFKPGMRFGSNTIFRKALRQYALENGFDYYYLHNDGNKVSAYCLHKCDCVLKHGRKSCNCKQNLCPFKACARKMGKDGSFQLKSWNPEHVCGWQERNSKVTSLWLAEKYLQVYRDDPLWRLKGFMRAVRREYMIEITYNQAWRARLRALLMTHGFAPEQYAQIWDYAAAVLKWNPGSSVYVKPENWLFLPFQKKISHLPHV